MKGRGSGDFVKGERLFNFDGVEPGDLIIMYSRQFEALNLIRIEGIRQVPSGHRIADWRYASPDGRVYGAPGHIEGAIWECDIDDSDRVMLHEEWWRAVPKEPGTLYSHDELLRHFGVRTWAGLQKKVASYFGSDAVFARQRPYGLSLSYEPYAGDQEDQHFWYPFTTEALSVGMTELLLQVNPAKAEREGEEFMLAMGEVSR